MSIITKEYNGSGPTASTITHLKHRTDDDYVNDSTHPIPIPSGANHTYGFWKTIALYDDTGNNTDIFSDIRIYGDADPSWTGATLYIGDETTDTYDQATGTIDETGDEMVANHDQVSARTSFFATYNSGNMKTVGLTGGVETLKPAAPARISKYVFMQVDVTSAAPAGSLANGTIKWRYSVTS